MDAHQNPHWLTYLMGALGLANLLQVFRRESKDERKAVLARLDAVERIGANHELRIQGTEHTYGQIMAELAKLPGLHVTVATVANDVKHLGTGITEIKNSLTQFQKPQQSPPLFYAPIPPPPAPARPHPGPAARPSPCPSEPASDPLPGS